jgi:hypothetical protein
LRPSVLRVISNLYKPFRAVHLERCHVGDVKIDTCFALAQHTSAIFFHALRARVDASLQNGNRSCSHPASRGNPLKADICCGAPDYFPAIAQRPPIHTTFRAARAPTRFDQSLVCDWGWVCCETQLTRLAVLANRISRAIGTPLEWPEAKKVASHVRSWGIEV